MTMPRCDASAGEPGSYAPMLEPGKKKMMLCDSANRDGHRLDGHDGNEALSFT
jgi:hypothetical protein